MSRTAIESRSSSVRKEDYEEGVGLPVAPGERQEQLIGAVAWPAHAIESLPP